MLNVGLGADSNEVAIAARRAPRGGLRDGRLPPDLGGRASTTRSRPRSRASAAHEKVRAIGETGHRLLPRNGDPGGAAARLRGADRDRRASTGLPIVIHARDPDGETGATDEIFEILDARAGGVPVILHCFLAPWRVRRRGRARLALLLRRRSSPTRSPTTCARPPRSCRPSCSWSRPTLPTWRRSRCGASPTSPPTSSRPPSVVAEVRGESLRGAGADGRGERARRSSAGETARTG